MPHKKYFHRPTVIKDVAIMVVVNVLLFFVFIQVDLLETVYQFSREFEWLELDELLPLGISVAISLLVFSYRRIKELGVMAEALEQMSMLDLLTNLPNRRAGQISLLTWCNLADKKQQPFVVFQINLNKFKKVNALYGQIVGDEVIKEVAQCLAQNIEKPGQLFRWLDDNFIVVVPLSTIGAPNAFAHQLQDSINNQVMPAVNAISCSIGYTVWQQGQQVEDILYEVEDALMGAKYNGESRIKGSL